MNSAVETDLCEKIKKAQTPDELGSLGAELQYLFLRWDVYKHRALGDMRFLFERKMEGGYYKLEYSATF